MGALYENILENHVSHHEHHYLLLTYAVPKLEVLSKSYKNYVDMNILLLARFVFSLLNGREASYVDGDV